MDFATNLPPVTTIVPVIGYEKEDDCISYNFKKLAANRYVAYI